ncbi:hypothetical protein DUNSADRAFT_14640 [Dunaliella salina]|uniref:ABM domain-containing protein n=1 Tax=Dunaliella salina TaxID=3046 RepID=A0ABQ7G724_DUNSA|nr:hypothetical protein DUNSADRAFT_14640 [Dunaliella salina]|eukprot:KAF5830396.1 hypothetical protein DUNSADRAFT_14640 [Dunaliella salina]
MTQGKVSRPRNQSGLQKLFKISSTCFVSPSSLCSPSYPFCMPLACRTSLQRCTAKVSSSRSLRSSRHGLPCKKKDSRSSSSVHAALYAEFHGGLNHLHSHQGLRAAGLRRETAYATIKFTVPPSAADEFEEAWMMLESEVKDKEDEMAVFDLKKTSLDNLFYLSYAEYDSIDGFVQHLKSDHFMKFAEAADSLGIMWSLQLLKDCSKDLEKERRGHREEPESKEDMAYILISYFVPPGEQKGLVDQWCKTAKTTLSEEKGNRMYSLSSTANDNTRWYAYGVWDSMEDFRDHFYSSHVEELRNYLADKDIVYFIAPLDKIGKQPE